MIIIDATNLILGRMAVQAAKHALLGEKIVVVNCEKAVISGSKKNIFDEYLNRMARGSPRKGPYVHRMPDKLVRKTIRGMIPYKKPMGKEAYKRVWCYVGMPEEFKDKKTLVIEDANISKLPTLKYIDLNTLSKRLGAKLE